jgi:hypothetical protein
MKRLTMRLAFAALVYQCATAPALGAASKPGDQLFKLRASDGAQFDEFGRFVDIDSGVVVVGAYLNDDFGDSSGSAYIFDATTGQQRFKLIPPGSAPGDVFGSSVAIDSGLALIGASGDDGAGAAFLYNVVTGQQLRKLTGPAQTYDEFGYSAALDGTTALIGAIGEGDRGQRFGAAYLFDAGTGQRRFRLTPNDRARFHDFGQSVSVSDGVAIVGAPGDGRNGLYTGAAYLFSTHTGQQLFKLTSPDSRTLDSFGYSVAVNGDYAIVGAPGHDVNGENVGAAYVFDVTTGELLRKLIAADRHEDFYFGQSVAIEGSVALVGAGGANVHGTQSGAAYMFDVRTGRQLLKLAPDDGHSFARFGFSVALDGDVGLIGAYLDGNFSRSTGAAYLFRVVPEPEAMALLVTTLVAAGRCRRRV